jgi:hypothetical protein
LDSQHKIIAVANKILNFFIVIVINFNLCLLFDCGFSASSALSLFSKGKKGKREKSTKGKEEGRHEKQNSFNRSLKAV